MISVLKLIPAEQVPRIHFFLYVVQHRIVAALAGGVEGFKVYCRKYHSLLLIYELVFVFIFYHLLLILSSGKIWIFQKFFIEISSKRKSSVFVKKEKIYYRLAHTHLKCNIKNDKI